MKRNLFLALAMLLLSVVSFAQNSITLKGKVTDPLGQPIIGANIQIKSEPQRGTITDLDGNYTLQNVSPGSTLIISSIGSRTQEVPVNGRTSINTILEEDYQTLDEVVVIGYGTAKKRDLTGSIVTVRGEEIASRPSISPVASLQGKVSGLTMVTSGAAGEDPTVRIRGINSTGDSSPLYIVDGVMQTSINYINPADIESMEVLKDPSSISIFGLQGGNGVIIINTKRAAEGETRVNFQSYVGFQVLEKKIKVTDAAGFRKLYDQQLANIGADPFDYTNYTADTDWQDEIFRTGFISNNTLSISSSGKNSKTYLNLGYMTQEGIRKLNDYSKFIGRLNEELKFGKYIKVGADVIGVYRKSNPAAGGLNSAINAAPIVPIKDADGNYYATPSFQRAQVGNPVAAIDIRDGCDVNDGYRFTGTVFAEIKFLKNFTWKSSFTGDFSFDEARSYTPLPFKMIYLGEGEAETEIYENKLAKTAVSHSKNFYKNTQQDHYLTYEQEFNDKHRITAMAGFSTTYRYNNNISGNRSDTTLVVPNDPSIWYLNIISPNNPGSYGSGANESSTVSFMGRVNYAYKNKYLLNATFRRDGSSKFAPGNQWGNFGSVGLGWIMSEEAFMKKLDFISFLKLKASWGTVGNGLNIGNYLAYPSLSTGGVAIFGNNIYSSVYPSYIPDPNLHWETVEGRDIGLESQFLNNRLRFTFELYNRKTHDILTRVTLPGVAGSSSYFTNLGTIGNKGVEILLGWNDKIGEDFYYSVSGNLSYNKNEVKSIGDNIDFEIFSDPNMTRSGYSIGYFYGYKKEGIFQTQEEVDASIQKGMAKPGDIKYADADGDEEFTPSDRTYLGTPFPKYNYGISLSCGYKGFEFSIDGQGVSGNHIYVQRRNYLYAVTNYEVNHLKAWTGPGTSNTEPILDITRSNNYLFSEHWLERGDYFRIKNVQFSYTFKKEMLQKLGVQKLMLYVNGQNLKTFTKATGYTPEVGIASTTGGRDNGIYPSPTVYTFGLNLTF